MEVLILHMQAPLMSFGGPQVDQIGPTGRFPTMSQITGMLANALGYTHRDTKELQDLQDRLSVASALVNEGEEMQDYQTVNLGQPHLRNPAWTTRGRTEHREGGPDARYGTHIRFRRFRADASVLSAVSLSPADKAPMLKEIGNALVEPERPLVIGRKPCVPATRLLVGIIEDAGSLTEGLARVPTKFPERWSEISKSTDSRTKVLAEWPVDDRQVVQAETPVTAARVVDQRNWRNQLHGGERIVAQGPLTLIGNDGLAGGAS